MKVSVIIPTYNRENCLFDLLDCLQRQNYHDFEIIVIDQSEVLSPRKKQYITDCKRELRYFHITEKGRSLAKNYGILHAKGEIILFCDDDITTSDDFLSAHAKHYSQKGNSQKKIGAVCCRLVEEGQPEAKIATPLKVTFYGKIINKPYSVISGYVNTVNGGNMSMSKKSLDAAGFFEENFVGTSMVEEPDISYRILKNGFFIYFDTSTTVRHFPQHNGNMATLTIKKAEWFKDYFNNLLIFHSKYGRFQNIPFIFTYCLMVSLKYSKLNKTFFKNFSTMMKGFFLGVRQGYELYKRHKDNLYYTPTRKQKSELKAL